ncbi:MAG TPA: hypothetical protein VNA16_10180, partial [Abditibacteriaceae bacterium]|nr:hypothetical protein [Abditibacteriaceae bacterium]
MRTLPESRNAFAKHSKWYALSALLLVLQALPLLHAAEPVQPAPQAWPPPLRGAVNGTVTVTTDEFLKVPAEVEKLRAGEGAEPFVVAKKAPTVDLAYHGDLADAALNGTGWSSWGDIGVASDGKVYSGTGNHGNNSRMPNDGGGNAYIYAWDPATKVLKQVADLNKVAGVQEGDPTWSKVHAGIIEGKDAKIYFSGTLNAGGRSFQTGWTERVPGGQLFQYDPPTGKTQIVGTFPGEVTPTTLMDRQRNIWYANMEGKTSGTDVALTAFDLEKRQIIYQSPHDAVTGSRNLALARDGTVYFNGKDGLWKYDPNTKTIAPTKSAFPDKSTMRSSTGESAQGYIYGTTMRPGHLFRYAPAQDKLEMLGRDFLSGDYTTVTVLSPDEKYVYYLPGAHGGAAKIGTPVVQYNIATGQRKVLAFLKEGMTNATGYAPAGTYGVKISADGSTLYVGFNGNVTDENIRPKRHAKGFGLTAFAAIHIPAS